MIFHNDPFAHRGSLHWYEIAPLLRRNAAPWRVIRINYYPNMFSRMVTVMDWHRPELAIRKGEWKPSQGESFGQHFLEEEAHAVVCNMAWINGECPMENIKGVWAKDEYGELTTRQLVRPERGVLDGVRILLAQGSLEPTLEVGLLLHDYDIAREARR